RPSFLAASCGGGYSSSSFLEGIISVEYCSSRSSSAESSIDSGWSCCSIHFSSPIFRTASTSPGRGPYENRFSAWRIASSSVSSVIGSLPLKALLGAEDTVTEGAAEDSSGEFRVAFACRAASESASRTASPKNDGARPSKLLHRPSFLVPFAVIPGSRNLGTALQGTHLNVNPKLPRKLLLAPRCFYAGTPGGARFSVRSAARPRSPRRPKRV